MAGWVALLRGINVGGHNKLPMASLTEIGAGLGLSDVSTYINSGNLLFSNSPAQGLESELAKRVFEEHGIDVPIVICSSQRLEAAIESNPFGSQDPKRVLVYFCSTPPTQSALESIDLSRATTEQLVPASGEIFLSVPDGAHKTKLTLGYLEKTLGITMTSRNLNTVAKLSSLTNQF